ncbi:fimbria/pilus periplasmic chaperone [Klebsiella aerogenes]|uniref:fimbria/pilus periplasmic chaperone n=1 Tax=Klebsiella aerogenes TaxID=548 RepID=UPI001BD222AF|nr:fimbria/pilus periplasmic chaperone [Klebsiella aerogenes]
MKNKIFPLLLAIAGSSLLLATGTAQAKGGVALGATRLIYPQGQKEISVPLTNTSTSSSYLVQSWIASANDQKSPDYILTPPLFVSKPKSENTLRVMYVGPDLPKDRESVFYLHSRSIPSLDKNALKDSNVLQIAIESVIKVFWRPQGLTSTSEAAQKSLVCSQSGSTLTLKNPSPYYVSLVSLYAGNKKLPNTMVPPKGNKTLSVSGANGGAITYKAINDYGALTAKITCGS